jgi:hypothetical protein
MLKVIWWAVIGLFRSGVSLEVAILTTPLAFRRALASARGTKATLEIFVFLAITRTKFQSR